MTDERLVPTDITYVPADPLRVLAQAILEGRLYSRSLTYRNRDGDDITETTWHVEDSAS